MSLKLYMDHNVHAAITEGLRDRGVDCITAFEDERAAADDDQILDRAAALSRIVFTQDVDFLIITSRRLASNLPFNGVIFASQMSVTIGQAVNDLELFAKIMEPEEMRNSLERIPLP